MPAQHRVQVTILYETFEATSAILHGERIRLNGRQFSGDVFEQLRLNYSRDPHAAYVLVQIKISNAANGEVKFNQQLALQLTGGCYYTGDFAVLIGTERTRFGIPNDYWELDFVKVAPPLLPELIAQHKLLGHEY